MYSKQLWVKQQKGKQDDVLPASKYGFYIFGGANEKKEPQNDLYFVRPYYVKNMEVLDPKKFEFLEHYETKLYVEVFKLEPKGIAPLP